MPWHFIFCLAFVNFFSVEESCAAMVLSNNVLDWLIDKGRELCWFFCKLHFCFSWEHGILQVSISLPFFVYYFQQFCNCFPFCKRHNAPLNYFFIAHLVLISYVEQHWWKYHVVLVPGEAVPLSLFHEAFPDGSTLPIRNSLFFGLPWSLKSIPHNIVFALC